jgi:hypothetical protein
MGIYTDQSTDHSKEDLTDVLGRRWGVFNLAGTGMFYVACYKLENGKPQIDKRVPAPQECDGSWTKREWAVDAINRYIARLNKETEEQTLRQKQKARTETREANAANPG